MKSKKKYHTFETISEGEADYDHSKWVGSIFFYLINLGRSPFHHFTQRKYGLRNLWTGYFLKLTIIALGLILILSFF